MEINRKNLITVVALNGRLEAQNSKQLLDIFENSIKQTSRFVFDCKALNFLDSSGLGAMVACLRKALSAGGDLRLAGLGHKAKMILEITQAEKLFDVYANVDQALDSFAGESSWKGELYNEDTTDNQRKGVPLVPIGFPGSMPPVGAGMQ